MKSSQVSGAPPRRRPEANVGADGEGIEVVLDEEAPGGDTPTHGLLPNQQASNGAPTVLGLKLVSGERVIYFYKHKQSPTAIRVILGTLGLPFLFFGVAFLGPSIARSSVFDKGAGGTDWGLLGVGLVAALVGLGLISIALFYFRSSVTAHVVTTQRVVKISTRGMGNGVSLDSVWDLRPVRRRTRRQWAWILDHLPGQDPWEGAIGVVMMDGRFTILTPDAAFLGPFLAKCVTVPGFVDARSTVPYEA